MKAEITYTIEGAPDSMRMVVTKDVESTNEAIVSAFREARLKGVTTDEGKRMDFESIKFSE